MSIFAKYPTKKPWIYYLNLKCNENVTFDAYKNFVYSLTNFYMNQQTSDITIETVNPQVLSFADFTAINEVTQDMWAYGIWELSQCTSCSKMLSKQEVFWHFPRHIYEKTVAKIMQILWVTQIPCPCCGSETKLVYGKENILNIQERLLESDSFLLLCRNHEGEIVGYMDGYIDSLETIFRREFHYHYSNIGYSIVREQVNTILEYSPPDMISFSSMGLSEKYTNFFLIFNMLSEFFRAIPERCINMPGITELDKNNNLYGIYKIMWSRSLEIWNIPHLKDKISNTGENYKSDIVVFPDPIRQAKEKFLAWIKIFLRSYRKVATYN